jgi:phenylalanine ammonia-lyase
MADILEKDIVPTIPLRGSISASGALIPLAYVVGTLQGKPSVTVWSGSRATRSRRTVAADVALREASLKPLELRPKEGLAIVNGTGVSAGVAALVMHNANDLAVLS